MKLLFTWLALIATVAAQSSTPSTSPISKEEALAHIQAQIAAQQAQANRDAIAKRAATDEAKEKGKEALAEWEKCTKLEGHVIAIVSASAGCPEGIHLHGCRMGENQSHKEFDFLLIKYPKTVTTGDFLSVAATESGTAVVPGKKGGGKSITSFRYFGPSEPPH